MKAMIYITMLLSFVFTFQACSTSRAGRVDVDEDVTNDVEISAKDMRTMARQMLEDIMKCPTLQGRIKKGLPPAKITIKDIVDETKDYDFSPKQLQISIRGQALKYARGYLTFVEGGKGKYKPDYILTGRAYSKQLRDKERVSKYHIYTLWLKHIDTGAIVWQKDYETKKMADQGMLYGRE